MVEVVRWILIALFAFIGWGLLSGAQTARGRALIGLLAGAVCYLGAAVLAVALKTFWPLGIGFVAAWLLRRLLHLDPGWARRVA